MSDSSRHSTVRSRVDIAREQQATSLPHSQQPKKAEETPMAQDHEQADSPQVVQVEQPVVEETETDNLDEIILDDEEEIEMDEDEALIEVAAEDDGLVIEQLDAFDAEAVTQTATIDSMVKALQPQLFVVNPIINIHLDDEDGFSNEDHAELSAFYPDAESEEAFNFNLPLSNSAGKPIGFMVEPMKAILEMVNTFNDNPVYTLSTDVSSSVIAVATTGQLVERATQLLCNVNFPISDLFEDGILLSSVADEEDEDETDLDAQNVLPFGHLVSVSGYTGNSYTDDEGNNVNVINLVISMRIPFLFSRFDRDPSTFQNLLSGIQNNLSKTMTAADVSHATLVYSSMVEPFITSDFHVAFGEFFRDKEYTVLTGESLIAAISEDSSLAVAPESPEDVVALSPIGDFEVLAITEL